MKISIIEPPPPPPVNPAQEIPPVLISQSSVPSPVSPIRVTYSPIGGGVLFITWQLLCRLETSWATSGGIPPGAGAAAGTGGGAGGGTAACGAAGGGGAPPAGRGRPKTSAW